MSVLDGHVTGTQTANSALTLGAITTAKQRGELIVGVAIAGAKNQISGITDSLALLTFTRFSLSNTSGPSLDVWKAHYSAPLTSDALTITISTAAQNWDAMAFGLGNTSGYDPNASLPGNVNSIVGGTPLVSGLSTTNAADVWFAVMANNASGAQTAGAGFTLIDNPVQTGIEGANEFEVVSVVQNSIQVPFGNAVGGTNRWSMIVGAVQTFNPSAFFQHSGPLRLQRFNQS